MSRRPADGTRPPPRRGRAIRLLIRAYQLTLSGLVGRQCRYLPSCSDYAAEAIGLHGSWAGGWIAAARLCRCHPWGGWGYDPVPVRREPVPWWMPWRYGVRRPRDPERSGHERASNSAAKP